LGIAPFQALAWEKTRKVQVAAKGVSRTAPYELRIAPYALGLQTTRYLTFQSNLIQLN